MILRNSTGTERNFRILFEFENNNKKYIVYEDFNTLNIYGGKVVKNKLKPLDDEEFIMLNNMLEKVKG